MPLRQINTQDQNLQLIQGNVADAIAPLEKSPLTGGVFISALFLSIGTNKVAHLLGRTPTRWAIMDLNASATIYRLSWDDKFLTLQSSTDCTVSLWVN
jgi:hypothetical protein